MECAKQGVFLEGKIGKTEKKISKIFIVPNRPKYHTDQLYTYKDYIDPVGFTEKRQNHHSSFRNFNRNFLWEILYASMVDPKSICKKLK